MKAKNLGRAAVCSIAAAALVALSACSESPAAPNSGFAPGDPGTQSIAALIAETDGLSSVETLIADAGMAQTFDGMAAYTVLAPTDAALSALGEAYTGDDARPALVAILRDHILPGYLTTQDIASAIESSGGPVEMQTMGTGTLTFAMDGDTLTVAGGEGSTPVAITGEMLGVNGVVIPIDTVLKDVTTDG